MPYLLNAQEQLVQQKKTIEKKEDPLTIEQELLKLIANSYDIPEIEYIPKPPPVYWEKTILTKLNFSQIALANWADGGDGSLALNTFVDMSANYSRGSIFWENKLQLGYGFVQLIKDIYKKTDDKIILDSKWGYKAIDKLFMSAIFNFKTQFSNGFKYSTNEEDPHILESSFMAPGNITLGLGADYKPFDFLSINLAPLTGNLIIVGDKELREKYGNKIGQPMKIEIGAQLKIDFSKKFRENWLIQTSLTLFSDFIDQPQNLNVNWDMLIDFRFSNYLSMNLRTNLIYDENILIADDAGKKSARVQFKEAFAVGLSYTFGSK